MGEPFHWGLRVRYAECDAQGVVFNANYLAFIDHSITEVWRAAFGGYAQMLERGLDMVVAESRLHFHAPARFDDELDIAVTITRMGTTGMATRHVISRAADGALVLDGRMRYVWVVAGTSDKAAIPDWARAALAPYLVVDEPAGA